ncbi:hypothetical protein NDU88_003491 [Pleurodeles waltl]|uniref:Uncharacterized protein n=1 Tax=Pleurodeles waltl TaxID=8319 RepID=A0AAV7LN99_PLEWA|nr:hypothetical protein NDU88_003491 [Pleurodeles waltl]
MGPWIINGGAARATQGASPKALVCLPESNTPRHRARPSPWRIPGWRSGPRPPGRPGERTRRRCGLLRPGGPNPFAREGPGSGRGARARLPGSGPSGRGSEAPPETEPTPTRHDPGRENRIEVPPRAGTTPERPAVLGRQGGLDEEEPGPAREPWLHPTRAGGWASPSRLARLGPPALSPGTHDPQGSRPRRADGRRAGGAETPPLVARYPGPSTGPRVLKTRAAPPGPPGGTGGGGAARAPSRSGNTPRPRVEEAPGPSAWKRSWNRGG